MHLSSSQLVPPSDDGSDVMGDHASDDGDQLAGPPLELSLSMTGEDGRCDARRDGCSRSCLKALPAPSPVFGSPFTTMLGFLHKEPQALQARREAAMRRQVQRMLRQIYRRSIEECIQEFITAYAMMLTLFQARLSRRQMMQSKRTVDKTRLDCPKDRGVMLPHIQKVSPLQDLPFGNRVAKATKKKGKQEQAAIPESPARKAAMRTLTDFGRCSQGGPYTLRQVYEEVEADIQHRPPVDVRAVAGKLGPELLGPGATLARRNLPFAHPQRLATESIEVTGATLTACNNIFRFAILHQQKPLFKADSGAIIYFDRFWKMNDNFNTNSWLYSPVSSKSKSTLPPEGKWTVQGSLGATIGAAPTLKMPEPKRGTQSSVASERARSTGTGESCKRGPVELQSPFLEMPELPELFAALGEGMGGPPPGIPAALWGSMCKKRLQDMHESNHLTVSEREEHLTKRQFHVPGRGKRTLTLQEDPTGKFGGSCGSGTVLWPAAMALVEHLDGEVEKSCLNCRVLELGAGVGAVGLFLALFKGCEVWLTEAPEQLPLLVRNVNENSPDGLDLQVAPLKWGDKEALEQLAALGRSVCGCWTIDVTYRPECLSDLLSTAHQLMSPQGRFFLSLQDRPGEAEHLEAALKTSSLQIRGEALRRKAKLQGAEEVSVLIFELCHVVWKAMLRLVISFLVATSAAAIWPKPRFCRNGTTTIALNPQSYSFQAVTSTPELQDAFQRYKSIFFPHASTPAKTAVDCGLVVDILDTTSALQLGVDESYTLEMWMG
eukprot:g26013.t1